MKGRRKSSWLCSWEANWCSCSSHSSAQGAGLGRRFGKQFGEEVQGAGVQSPEQTHTHHFSEAAMPQCTVRWGCGKPIQHGQQLAHNPPGILIQVQGFRVSPSRTSVFASEVSCSTQANKMGFSGTSLGISVTNHSPNVSVSRSCPSGQAVGCSGHSMSHLPWCIAGQAGKVLPLCPARPAKTFLEISVNE